MNERELIEEIGNQLEQLEVVIANGLLDSVRVRLAYLRLLVNTLKTEIL